MELEALAGLVFAFLMTVTIGGIILLKPLMRNLGNYLESKADERRGIDARSPEDWERLFNNLESLGKRIEAIKERQDFTEKLLARPKSEGGG